MKILEMNKNKVFLCMIFLMIFALTNCLSPVTAEPVLGTHPANFQPTITKAVTIEPAHTPTIQAYFDNMTRDCVKILDNPQLSDLPTVSLFIDPVEYGESSFILNLPTGSKTFLGRTLEATVSGNGGLVAYWDLDKTSVIVSDNGGNIIRVIQDSDEKLTPVHWIDDQRLLLSHRTGEMGGEYSVESLMIMDLKTGNLQEWLPEYPSLDTWPSSVSWNIFSRFLFNPELTYLVYQAREEGSNWLILWDIEKKKEVTRVFGTHNDDTPWWSPDGKQFVTWGFPQYEFSNNLYFTVNDGLPYVGGVDLFSVDQSGEIKRLTYFSTTKFAVESSTKWSPNGTAIAFMLQLAGGNENILDVVPELSVLTLDTNQVTNLCISGYDLMWSPDGKYIMLNQGQNEGKERNEVYIVDLDQKLAWKVAENAEGQGWMTEKP
jgi:hypothetical protein